MTGKGELPGLVEKWREHAAREHAHSLNKEWPYWVRYEYAARDYTFRACADELETALSRGEGRVVAYPDGSDRDVLLYLMQQFDAESWECRSCGHSEDCASMDSADYLRRYLSSSPAQNNAAIEALGVGGETHNCANPDAPCYHPTHGDTPQPTAEHEPVAWRVVTDEMIHKALLSYTAINGESPIEKMRRALKAALAQTG